MCREEEAKMIWIGSKKGKFSIKALYLALESESKISFLISVIWNSFVKSKAGFFALEAT